jgi:GxxExxY protein
VLQYSNPADAPKIGVDRRLWAANNNSERYRFKSTHRYWPLMNADERGYFDNLTERVLGAVLEVSNTLGAGFLEKVYERALLRELGLRGIRATTQASFPVTYKGHCVGEFFADLLVEDVLVVELKCVERLANEHTAQCLNYLRASGRTLCLLVNFQKPKVEWKRIVHGFQIAAPHEASAEAV